MTKKIPRRSLALPSTRLMLSLLAGIALGVSLVSLGGYSASVGYGGSDGTCGDTDGGIDYDVSGTVSGNFQGRTYSFTDQCVGDVLYENSCRSGTAIQESYTCSGGCSHGRCDSGGRSRFDDRYDRYDRYDRFDRTDTTRRYDRYEPSDRYDRYDRYDGASRHGYSPRREYCYDSDRGRDLYVRGTLSTTYGDRTTTHTDTCVGDTLYENECDGSSAIQTSIFCQYGCSRGACMRRYSDGGGTYRPPYGGVSCSETDSGYDIDRRGRTTAYSNGRSTVNTDYCTDRRRLVEYTCTSRTGVRSDEVSCPYSCIDGACVDTLARPPLPARTSCSDTDGGLFYRSSGRISGYLNGRSYSFTDTCANSGEIYEYYCNGSEPVEHLHSCRYGCSNSRCLSF